MEQHTRYPNQIDGLFTNPKEALVAIENTLGTNPQGSEFSTVGDRLNAINKELKLLSPLLNKDYLHSLNFGTILALGNTTDGYDIILGIGDCITSADQSIYLKGNVTIAGGLDLSDHLDLDNNLITNLPFPTELHHATNKQYVDNQISAQNNKLNDITNNIINNNGNYIQYGKGKTDILPTTEPNKFLKRNTDNTAWIFEAIELKPIYDKFETLTKLINNVSKNNTSGNDITVNIGDAIKSEDGILNIDSNTVIHGNLSAKGIDLEYSHIDNLLDPISDRQATTKKYVDDRLPTTLVLSDVLKEDQINYNIENLYKCDYLRLEGSESAVIHGIKFPDTYVKFDLINVGENNIILKNDSQEANFGNRFKLVDGNDKFIKPNESVCLLWDAVSSFWRIIY